MIFFGQRSLERAVTNFVQHYHGERNHQGLGNELIDPSDNVGAVAGNRRPYREGNKNSLNNVVLTNFTALAYASGNPRKR
jgi:hypothetical protein